jgi:hypothetical protein
MRPTRGYSILIPNLVSYFNSYLYVITLKIVGNHTLNNGVHYYLLITYIDEPF